MIGPISSFTANLAIDKRVSSTTNLGQHLAIDKPVSSTTNLGRHLANLDFDKRMARVFNDTYLGQTNLAIDKRIARAVSVTLRI